MDRSAFGWLLFVFMVVFFEIDVGNCSGTLFLLFSEILGDFLSALSRGTLCFWVDISGGGGGLGCIPLALVVVFSVIEMRNCSGTFFVLFSGV